MGFNSKSNLNSNNNSKNESRININTLSSAINKKNLKSNKPTIKLPLKERKKPELNTNTAAYRIPINSGKNEFSNYQKYIKNVKLNLIFFK